MQLKTRWCLILALAGAVMAAPSWAGIGIDSDEEDKETVSELTWTDRSEMARRQEAVENLGQRHFGQSLRNDKSDLQLLQRIADGKLISKTDTDTLQGLGVILGNVLAGELGLEWKAYSDEMGRSRALCVPNSEDCLFPVTMLSRRLEVGLNVNVADIYNQAVATIEPYLPDTNAYDGTKPDPRERPGWLKDRPTKKPPVRIRVQ